MNTLVVDDSTVSVPAWVRSLASFRRWARSDAFPEHGRICWFRGEVWVDMSKEQFFSHNQVKGEFTFRLVGLVKAGRLGRYVPDGMLLSNAEADLSCQPDGAFLSRESLRTRRVRLVEGTREGFVELEGTPDMVLEGLSASSVEKDTVTLKELYWQAGIPEYWLVDARQGPPTFEIHRHAPKGYALARKQAGWVKSAVFGKSFRLTQQLDELGDPELTLEMR